MPNVTFSFNAQLQHVMSCVAVYRPGYMQALADLSRRTRCSHQLYTSWTGPEGAIFCCRGIADTVRSHSSAHYSWNAAIQAHLSWPGPPLCASSHDHAEVCQGV